MKKPHKPKARKPAAKERRAHSAPAPLVAHSTRRLAPARPAPPRIPRPQQAEPATVWRRTSPLTIVATADKQAFRVLLLPFVVMAFALAVLPTLHVYPTLRDLIAATPFADARPVTATAELRALPAQTVQAARLHQPAIQATPLTRSATALIVDPPAALAAISLAATPLSERSPLLQSASAVRLAPPLPARSTVGSRDQLRPVTPPTLLGTTEQPRAVAHLRVDDTVAAAAPHIATLAATPPVRTDLQSRTHLALLQPPPSPRLLTPVPLIAEEANCPVLYGSAMPDDGTQASAASEPFGHRLARAAAAQTQHFVIYDDKYRPISRAGGDVPSLYGVCTDVIIRAYRSIGVDLQVLVQAARVGAGDPNIDHRRTETLRRYLARFGRDLPVTTFGENYQPGDIVTYWRPQNSGSRSHIAIVAAERGPSGNPMIIHNRGWGPQIEDGLFVDRITGHYRYDGSARPPVPPQVATSRARPFSLPASAMPISARGETVSVSDKPKAF